ncbi:glycoside hydrolase family 13 protein [Haloprofundus salilacus]|uniref:glycoside hydrolase family 13 protein n=1 Tax=Haloprofundus salilacus TaxID=2876190 RepID=UPI001CCAB3CE|nr:alpha-glucosidase [Haloprofundus salilacus]
MSNDRPWWRDAVIYQVYPRSFNDTDGDGIGDIPGIIEKLDYFEELGVDALWLSPVYDSPNVDNGYDVSDYRAIMTEFGTMDDWEDLIDGLHERGMRLIMDMVLNHTSTDHEWFQRARRGDDDYRDYYFWRESDGETPPNDWEAVWGGTAWEYDETAAASYLHLFHERQADLDWDNPTVREEIFEIVDWWLEKGVDGFRLDSINLISKPEGLPDTAEAEDPNGISVVANGPRVEEHLRALCERTHAYNDVVTIGETPDLSVDRARSYVGSETDSLSMVLNFEHVEVDRAEEGLRWEMREWELPELKSVIERWQTGLVGDEWQGLYFNNHDQPRAVSRFGDDGKYRRESAKVIATLLLTLRGTPFVYQGEEIGMTNPWYDDLREIQDIATRRTLAHAIENGEVSSFEEVKEDINRRTRDNARTPVQWTDGEHAGFTDGEPWLRVNDDYESVNVADARTDPDSIWHYYRDLIDLRKEQPLLVDGEFELLVPDHEALFMYLRSDGDKQALVALNFDDEATTIELPESIAGNEFEALIGNYSDETVPAVDEALRPYEARVYEQR